MKVLLVAAVLAAVPAVAAAQFVPMMPQMPTVQMPQTAYDPNTGNSYTTQRRVNGGADVSGFNARTGSMWNSHYDAQGNGSGTDAQGRIWNSTRGGSYVRSDGVVCVGQGAARTCSGG